VLVVEAISREFRVALPWELSYADDLVVIAEKENDLIKRLNVWKDNVQNRCNFYSNRSTFEKVIQKIQRGPDFMKHGVVLNKGP